MIASSELSVGEVRWEFEEEPGEPLPNFAVKDKWKRLNVTDAEAVYLNQIVELGTQLLSYRTINQILLGQLRDIQQQLEHCRKSRRELQARYRTRIRHDIPR